MENKLKWQPIILVINKRLECKCGALAIFVTGDIEDTDSYNELNNVDVWCQDCMEKAQEEDFKQ